MFRQSTRPYFSTEDRQGENVRTVYTGHFAGSYRTEGEQGRADYRWYRAMNWHCTTLLNENVSWIGDAKIFGLAAESVIRVSGQLGTATGTTCGARGSQRTGTIVFGLCQAERDISLIVTASHEHSNAVSR